MISFCSRWIFLALLVVVGALVPKDRFELAPSIAISSAVWAVLLHPGSTNSSGVVSLASSTLDLLMRRQHPVDVAKAKAEFEDAKADFEAAQDAAGVDGADNHGDLKKPKLVLPPPRQVLAGGGSLAAMGELLHEFHNLLRMIASLHFAPFPHPCPDFLGGHQMSQPGNREAAVSCEPEIEPVLAWFRVRASAS